MTLRHSLESGGGYPELEAVAPKRFECELDTTAN
jgi:hypothetical protein